MSTLFGPVVQQGYVVPNVRAAIDHWLARGVGPFFVEELDDFEGVVDGETVRLNLTAAFAYSGDQQIEVIEPRGDVPSIYEAYLNEHPEGGLQHLAVWVDNIDAKLADLEATGHAYRVHQRYGDGHAYIDSVDAPGVMIQLMAHNEFVDELFRLIKQAADDWDGAGDPVRKIDWSTGAPVIKSLQG
jgi:catechol 2,3-dioxygenase-like lactoylglutathione lyase family enzyme